MMQNDEAEFCSSKKMLWLAGLTVDLHAEECLASEDSPHDSVLCFLGEDLMRSRLFSCDSSLVSYFSPGGREGEIQNIHKRLGDCERKWAFTEV